ncbi:Heparinase II/III-like protein [Verrucomicrobium sp. GAS474]|uniref:heparinase II/III domain-containing protein n=1 Tax=Verrucomicrobium sp. GAS474 TaxID=1882831 RepID=UPI000879F849|nr:heparinase II/III family protein [Verrucomicrobium sp. GAS474]SDT88612.1 Heparinase II/III-like protein [Verrucomicrobium sp. GAS474]
MRFLTLGLARAAALSLSVASLLPAGAAAQEAAPAGPPVFDPARAKEIAGFLDPVAKGVGPAIEDRKAWEALGADAAFRARITALAVRYLTEPVPEVTSALYAASAQSGDRKIDNAVTQRRFRLANLVLAEGMENQGRFVPAIEKELAAICSETSWILSGHAKFTKFNDLGTAMTSWNLATADAMLGDRLSPDLRKTIRDLVRQRVIAPYLDSIQGKKPIEWWANNQNNWSAVVHGGIVGSALALDDSVEERAQIIAAAEKETQFYIAGFPADGYSLEGMGYWKYGFGHYVLLAEAILSATHGKVSVYSRDNIRLVAQFPRRFEMITNVWPAYSDSMFMEQPSLWLFHIIDHRYGFGDNTVPSLQLDGMFCTFLYAWGINLAFDEAAPPLSTGDDVLRGRRLRDWFGDSQILVGRPPEGQPGLSFSCKGGNNGTSHGHDDLGTYTLVLAKEPILVDPGSMVYDGRTFSSKRYEIALNNSYGHDVPKVAGQLQKEGAAHAAAVVAKEFGDDADSVTLDITKGYAVPALKTLTRRFDYVRSGGTSLTVADHVEFASPQDFGTAVVTYGIPTEEKPGVWTVTREGETVRIEITSDLPFTVTNETLKDEGRAGKLHRLGIDLQAPATQATLTVKIVPVVAGR